LEYLNKSFLLYLKSLTKVFFYGIKYTE